MDQAVSDVLNSSKKPEEVILSVSKSNIVIMNSSSREVSFPLAHSYHCQDLLPLSLTALFPFLPIYLVSSFHFSLASLLLRVAPSVDVSQTVSSMLKSISGEEF